MIDRSLEYIPFCMLRKAGTPCPPAPLAKGFHFRLYEKGDEKNWTEIETSVNEFEDVESAQAYFKKDFTPFGDELYDRMTFLCTDEGEAIGTITAWNGNMIENKILPCIHWVAIKPGYQGLGLGKSLVAHGINRMIELDGDVDFYLATQTWSYKAVGIYKWAGFDLYEGNAVGRANEYEKAVPVLKELLNRD